MRPAEFEGFYYLCPANDDSYGWHRAHPFRDSPQPCDQCGRDVKPDQRTSRWISTVPFLIIEEEPV